GITSSNEKNAIVCSHQFTVQAVLATGNTLQAKRYVAIRAEIRKATIPDVAENFPRGFGLNTNRRNDRPIMATSTATAQTATNVPYQLCVPCAFESPRKPRRRCCALTQAKARNPHTTKAWSMPTIGRSRTTRYCRMTSTKTRHNRLGILS